MKIKLKATPEQVELIKALGSKTATVSAEASETFATFIGDVTQKVLKQAGTAGLIYQDSEYDEDDSPSYPLDLYYDQADGHISIWSQSIAGGMPSNEVSGVKELKIATYRLDTAVSMLKKYARKARLDVVSKTLEKMAQEILVKQERNAWAVVLKALAEGSTHKGRYQSGGAALRHILNATTTNVFQVNDLNKMMTRMRRLNVSFAGGSTPDSAGLTDLFVSPEIKEQIRGFAYQPMNTRTVDGASGTPAGSSTAMPLPDGVREEIFRSAGASEIYGVSIIDLPEFGDGEKYNLLFKEFAGATNYDSHGTFTSASDQILVGLDLSRDAFIRPVARQSEGGATFVAQPDDQFVSRQDKVGWYGSLEESRVALDARVLVGLIV